MKYILFLFGSIIILQASAQPFPSGEREVNKILTSVKWKSSYHELNGQRQKIKLFALDFLITFNADYTVSVNSSDGRVKYFRWRFDPRKKRVNLINVDGKVESTFARVNGRTLLRELNDPNSPRGLAWYFVKNE